MSGNPFVNEHGMPIRQTAAERRRQEYQARDQRRTAPPVAEASPFQPDDTAEYHCTYCRQLKRGRFIRSGITNGWDQHMTGLVWACFDCAPEKE